MKIGWAFFSLAVIAMLAYGLNRGIYVGSELVPGVNTFNGRPNVTKNCRYLFPSGIHAQWANTGWTEEEADDAFCALFAH